MSRPVTVRLSRPATEVGDRCGGEGAGTPKGGAGYLEAGLPLPERAGGLQPLGVASVSPRTPNVSIAGPGPRNSHVHRSRNRQRLCS